jgi:cytochrome c1
VRFVFLAISAACLLCFSAQAQYGRARHVVTTNSNPMAYKGLVVTLHGSVKKLTKKEILLQSDDQLLTIRCSHKTKFSDSDGEIKATAVDLESTVTIDATEDVDLKLIALNVRVDAGSKKVLAK